MNGLGGKGPLKVIASNAPATCRDIINWIRVLRAPSNLTLNVPRDRASTTSLGNLGQGLTTLNSFTLWI